MSDKDLIKELAEDEKVKRLEVHHVYDDEEEEIDLVELAKYLWSKKVIIAGVTAVFLAAGACYNFVLQKPVYGMSAKIRIPSYNNMQMNTCLEVVKNDIGKINDGKGNGLSGVTVVKGSSVLELSFSGKNPEAIVKLAKDYVPNAQKHIYSILNEEKEMQYRRSQIGIIKDYLKDFSNDTANKYDKTADLVGMLDRKLREAELARVFVEPEVLTMPTSAGQIGPNTKKNMGIPFAIGLVLSCGWYVAKFLFKDMKKA